MMTKFVGNLRKFCSSVGVGGERSKHSPMKGAVTERIDQTADVVVRIRSRAEKYEAKADTATPAKSIELNRIATELRYIATCMRLNDWNDSDEI